MTSSSTKGDEGGVSFDEALRIAGGDPALALLLLPSLEDAAYNAEYERKGISVGDNNPEYRPYCLRCSTMRRMEHRDYGYQCSVCGNQCQTDGQAHHDK